MSFRALARTWRPQRFEQLVGQTHVVRALGYALENNKLHHALLFSGTRGVGKTTLARIIAKCLNCEHGVSATPCDGDDLCSTCAQIEAGRFVDLIEVDAASRTGVDDTRELMDNVQYAPTRGRTKVYLIDEVHMLSKHSFNALLKTLEEPPPRVQFLLATTEPEKIPVTILSRCLQFPLKRLPKTDITAQLEAVLAAEGLQPQPDALDEIAQAADGSMRDGLSLLDQALAFGGGQLDADNVRDMLGTIGRARIADLTAAIAAAESDRALSALDELYAEGVDMHYLLGALATAWQHIACLQIAPESAAEPEQAWRDMAAGVDAATVQVFYDVSLAGIRDLAYAPDPYVGTKMTVLRMLAFAPAQPDAPDEGAPTRSTPRRRAPETAAEQAPGLPAAGASETRSSATTDSAEPPGSWHTLVPRLGLTGLAAQLANNGVCKRLDNERIELQLAKNHELLATARTRESLQAAIGRYYEPAPAPDLRVTFVDQASDTPAIRHEQQAQARQQQAEAAIQDDPVVGQLRERLGAVVRPETIEPRRDSRSKPQRDDP